MRLCVRVCLLVFGISEVEFVRVVFTLNERRMANRDVIMRGLLNNRERRNIKLSVARLSWAELRAELEEIRCSTEGSIETLRDRLTRALIKEGEPRVEVPWYPSDNAPKSTPVIPLVESDVEPNFLAGWDNLNTENRGGAPQMSGNAGRENSADSSSSYELPPRAFQTTVDVHTSQTERKNAVDRRVVICTPMSTSPTTSVITTQAQMSGPVIITGAGHRFEPERTGRLTSRDFGLPRMTVREALSRYPIPAEYTYFTAQMVRSGVPPVDRDVNRITEPNLEAAAEPIEQAQRPPQVISTPSRRLATPTVTTSAHNNSSACWYTPAENLNEIRNASRNSHLSESSSRSDRTAYEERVDLSRRRRVHRVDSRSARDAERVLHYSTDGREGVEYLSGVESRRMRDRRVNKEFQGVNSQEEYRRETPSVLDWEGYVPELVGRKQLDSENESYHSQRSQHSEKPESTTRDFRPRRRAMDSRRLERPGRDRSDKQSASQKLNTVKILKNWGITKFAGEEKLEDPEEFLEQIEECRDGSAITDAALLTAIPCCLTKKASRWFRTERTEIRSWRDFCRRFRNHFMKFYDREDLMDDLQRRTQAEGEKITSYLSSFKYIVSRFSNPPSERQQVELAYRKLHPKYRDAIGDKVIETLDDIEKYGRIYERKKDLDLRYLPPPAAEKMRVPGAAYTGPRKPKVAAVKEEEEEGVAGIDKAPGNQKGGKGKGKGKNKAASNENESNVPPDATADSEEAQTPLTYAAAVQNTGQGNFARNNPSNSRSTGGQSQRENFARDSQSRGQQSSQGAGFRGEAVSPKAEASGYQQPNGAKARASAREGEFVGACYTCQKVGHRSSECPEIQCFGCREKGHTRPHCPHKATVENWIIPSVPGPRDRCQGCGKPDVTVKSCPSCAVLFKGLGNAQRGAQK